MMVGDTAMERVEQIRAAGLQPTVGEIDEAIGVGFAGDQGVEDRPAADADDIADDVRELQIRILERLLNPQHMPGDFVDELPARAREVAEFLNRRGRDEAAANQSVRQQVGNPRCIIHVAFATWYVANVHRVGQDQREMLFEHMPHRLPVHACRFHRHVRTRVRREPLSHIEETSSGRGNRAMFVGDLRTGCDPSTGGDTAGVDIQPGAARIQNLHGEPPSTTPAWSPRRRNLRCALAVAIRGARGTPGPTRERALSTIGKPTSAPASPHTVACFMTTRARRRRVGN